MTIHLKDGQKTKLLEMQINLHLQKSLSTIFIKIPELDDALFPFFLPLSDTYLPVVFQVLVLISY